MFSCIFHVGTKVVARDMKKVCADAKRDEGKTWFTELSDKGIEPYRCFL